MRFSLTCLVILLVLTSVTMAVERKPYDEVNSDKLASELQATAPSGEDNMNFAWWVPIEFWEVVMSQDESAVPAETEEMLEALRPYAMIAIVNADISSLGSFRYYSRTKVAENTTMYYLDETGARHDVVPAEAGSDDVEILLGVFKPILRSAMGRMGENMHFYVIEDQAADGGRLIDPYSDGKLVIDMTTTDGEVITATIPTPVDALFVPRKCPNGRDAHISWEYCPWTGEKLAE